MSATNETTTAAKTPRKTSRRGLMRLAAPVAASAAALAATGALRPGAAHAAPLNDGDTMQLGTVMHDTSTTWIINDVGPGNDVTMILLNQANISPAGGARGYISALTARANDGGAALHGGIGVLGINGQAEFVGASPVLAKLFAGVYGLTYPTFAPEGYGVIAHSVGGLAPLWIVPQGTSSATGFDSSASPGSLWADSGGAIWNMRNGNHTAAAYELSSLNFLPVPIRLLDTRAGAPVGNDRPNAPVPYHGTINVPAGGVTYQGQSIPLGAIAVFGLLTAALAPGVNCGDGSSAIAWATGATRPAAVNLIFNPQDKGGAYSANLAMVRLGTGGDFSIFSQPIFPVAVDYLFDCYAYVI